MCVNVKTTDDRNFTVNGKPVFLDHNDKWIANNLDAAEMKTAFNHIRSLQNQNS